MSIPYVEHRELIVSILRERAAQGRTIYYGDLADKLGVPARGPWKPILDEISLTETAAGRPDITYLVVSRKTGMPAQIGFEPANPPTPTQKSEALATIQKVYSYYKTYN